MVAKFGVGFSRPKLPLHRFLYGCIAGPSDPISYAAAFRTADYTFCVIQSTLDFCKCFDVSATTTSSDSHKHPRIARAVYGRVGLFLLCLLFKTLFFRYFFSNFFFRLQSWTTGQEDFPFSHFLPITLPPDASTSIFLHQGAFCLLSDFTDSVQDFRAFMQ